MSAIGLRNGIVLEGAPRGLIVLPSMESMEETDGGLFNNDLSPQSILDDTFDKSSLGEALETLLKDSDLVKTDFELPSLLRSVLDDLSEVCEGVLERDGRDGEDETLDREGVLGRSEDAGVLGMAEPNTLGCGNLPSIGNL